MSDRIVLPESVGEGEARLPGLALGIDIPWHDSGDGWVTGVYVATPGHCGWDGVVHGGVTAYLVDEALAFVAAAQRGMVGMTLRLDIRYRRPLFVGTPFTIRGRVTDRREGLAAVLEVQVEDAAGVCVTAEAAYRLARASVVRRLLDQLREGPPPANGLGSPAPDGRSPGPR